MTDEGHEAVDELLKELEARLFDEYKQAAEDIQAKLLDYWQAFEKKDKGMKQNVKDGKITQKQYDNWRIGQFVVGTRWLNLLDELATDFHNVNQIAKSMIFDYVPAAYAENHNFMTYQIEHKTKINTSFTLYNHEAVERIMTENPQMLPPPGKKRSARIAAGEEAAWNKKQIQSVATQAILQGESIPEVAHRLAETVGERNMNAAVRDARTMMTNAENLGREDSIKRANELGIPTRKVWLATLDGRTRHAHRQLDGQVVDEDKPFKVDGHEIWRPGDPKAPPYLVYNCFVGDTKVASDSELIRSYKHKYEGKLIKVKTAGGVDFTCTPNHPILTPNGWVAANRLNKGDDILVTFIGNRSALRRYSDVNHIHPSMEALHNSLKRMGTVSRDAAVTVNFHGDIPTSDVEIVRKKRLLRDNFNSCFGNFFDKFFLKNSDSFAFRVSHFVKRFGTIGKSSFSFVSGGRKSLSFFWRRICHSHIHGFGTISRNDFSLTEYPIDDLAAKSVIGGELLYRLSGKIFLDKIVSVDVSVLNTHVYNLQTKNGYYFTNSIIPHNNKKSNGIFAISKNCRCTMLSDIKDFELSDRIKGFELRNDPRLGGMSYEEWKNATGNEAFFKMSRNAKKDRDQYYAYRKMKVAGYPQTFGEFQRMKYYEPDKWKAVKSAVREKRTQKAQRAKKKKKADEK